MSAAEPTTEQLITLFHETHDLKIRDKIIEKNMPLIKSLLTRANVPTNIRGDIIQQAVANMIRGIDLFDPSRGYRFGSYLGRVVNSAEKTVRSKQSGLTCKWDRQIEFKVQFENKQQEAYSFAGLTKIKPLSAESWSVPQWEPSEEFFSPTLESVESSVLNQINKEKIDLMIDQLPRYQGFVIREVYGIGTGYSKTFEEIATTLGKSKQAIHQAFTKGVKNLKMLFEKELKDIYES